MAGEDQAQQTTGNNVAATPRALPHSVELEQRVLAALLSGENALAVRRVRDHISHPLAFFSRNHRLVYMACMDLDDNNEPIDVATVAEWLGRLRFHVSLDRLKRQENLIEAQSGGSITSHQWRSLYRFRDEDQAASLQESTLAEIGGYSFLTDLATLFSSTATLEHNAKLIWDYYAKRRLITRLRGLCDHAYHTTDTFDKLVDDGGQLFLEMGGTNKSGESIKPVDGVVEETLQLIAAAEEKGKSGVSTGYDQLDEALMSLRAGGLYILAARPGAGKTSFALNMVERICEMEEKPHVLFFSLEVDSTDLMKKMISARAQVEFRKLEQGGVNSGEMELLISATEHMKQWHLYLTDIADLTVSQMRSHLKRHQLENEKPIDIIIIDYLQLLNATHPSMSEYEKVSDISRTLKLIAKEMQLPIVALSQLSREGEKGAGSAPREPRLSDLRGSGSIEQDADAVIFLHRVNPDAENQSEREMKVVIAKNRFGPIASVPMSFYPGRGRFIEIQNAAESGYMENRAQDAVAAATAAGSRMESDDEDLFD